MFLIVACFTRSVAQALKKSAIAPVLHVKAPSPASIPATNTFAQPNFLPADYYASHLAFFCRQELKLQKLHMPLTFRVGSMDNCNYLEQKPGYRLGEGATSK
jgi:hypothetical protein